jgi:hydrogenase maturation protein HypF
MHIGVSKPAKPLPHATSAEALLEGLRMEMIGTVDCAGVCPWVYRVAREVGVTGHVACETGGIYIDAFGTPALLQAFQNRPSGTTITQLRTETVPYEPVASFEIVDAAAGSSGRLIPPDVPTCPDCLREMRDSADRRFAYPFINCATCGPRFTIATAAPYARANTTMSGFAMCPA